MPFFTSPTSSPVLKRRKTDDYLHSEDLFSSQFLANHTSQDFNLTELSQVDDSQSPVQSQLMLSPSFNFTNQLIQSQQYHDEFDFSNSQSQPFFSDITIDRTNNNCNDQEQLTPENPPNSSVVSLLVSEQSSPPPSSPKLPLQEKSLNRTQSSNADEPARMQTDSPEALLDDDLIPKAIMELHETVRRHNYSDWTFTSLIAGQLCTEMFPLGVYNNLKIALLMSLVSPPSDPLHIIAIGHDTSHTAIVMKELGKFSQRFLSVGQNYNGITVKNGTAEAGPMALSMNGVAYTGNWSRLPPKVVEKYLREIELQHIIVDKLQRRFPLKSSIWSYWSQSGSIKKDTVKIEYFLNVFGIPIISDDPSNDDRIIDDLLQQVSVTPSERFTDFEISEQDFQTYIDYARNLTVKFDTQAEVMLKNYFIATKNIRPDTLTEKAYDVLKKFAECHAKLRLQTTVMRQDVLVAISICEKFIKLLFDTDSYSSPNESKVTSMGHYDAYMSELLVWYSCFTKDILEKM